MRIRRRRNTGKHISPAGKPMLLAMVLIAAIAVTGIAIRLWGDTDDPGRSRTLFAEGTGSDENESSGKPNKENTGNTGDGMNSEDKTSGGDAASPLVVIDAGHGGEDGGAEGVEILEKDVCLDIALKLQKLLEDDGVRIHMIRTDDSNTNSTERIMTANRMKASLFLSVHCNSFEDPAYGGTETLYYPSDTLHAGNLYEKEYAQIIQSELVAALGLTDRGIVERPGLAVVHRAEMPSVIAEIGFLSNQNDLSILKNDDGRQKTAEALKKGILKALEKVG